MQISPATVQDESSLKTLLQACALPEDDISTSHLAHFFVVIDGGQVVGSVGIERCEKFGLLRSLALTKSLRGRGLGSQLVKHIEIYARFQQITSLYLLTTSADHFFSHIGYQSIHRKNAPVSIRATLKFQSICPDSAICMYKELD